MKQLPLLFASALALTSSVGLAHAATVSGELWEVTNTEASNATPAEIASLPAGLPGATFTVPSGNLSFNPTDSDSIYTLGTFLSSGGVSSAPPPILMVRLQAIVWLDPQVALARCSSSRALSP